MKHTTQATLHLYMMTSSNGKNFRITGPLCGEFTGHRWNPRTKASDGELWVFSLICAVNKRLSKQSWGWRFETLPCSLWHCNDQEGSRFFSILTNQCLNLTHSGKLTVFRKHTSREVYLVTTRRRDLGVLGYKTRTYMPLFLLPFTEYSALPGFWGQSSQSGCYKQAHVNDNWMYDLFYTTCNSATLIVCGIIDFWTMPYLGSLYEYSFTWIRPRRIRYTHGLCGMWLLIHALISTL